MLRETSSSSSLKTTSLADDKILLKFYQKKFEEFQKQEDRYKEKVDRHLKSLVTDRHELEEEVLRRGEKIADLQKALVELQLSVFEERERFLKVSTENDSLKENEHQLHFNIRQLLAMTHQQDLRDKIIYILKDPKVEIGYQTEFPTKSKSAHIDSSVNKKLKEEIDYLNHQLEEVLHISKSKADVVLEDCKQALEKSKTKLMQDEIQIRELQKQLHDLNSQERAKSALVATKSAAEDYDISKHASQSSSNVCSDLREMHLSLILLSKCVSKVSNILNTHQATKLYQKMAKIPRAPSDMPIFVEESSILQLEKYLRQCTRLTYDIDSTCRKILYKLVSKKNVCIQNSAVLETELKHLKELLKEMTVVTAENDLLNVNLRRSTFYYALRDSSVVLPEADRIQLLNDFKKIISNNDKLHKTVLRTADFVESVLQKYDDRKEFTSSSIQEISSTSPNSTPRCRSVKSDSALLSSKQAKSQSLKDLEKLLGIYKRTVQEAKNLGFGFSTEAKLMTEKLEATEKELREMEELENIVDLDDVGRKPEVKETEFKPSNHEDILRKINKTLSKVKMMEQGKFLKDEEMCRKLAEDVNNLTKKFKEWKNEFNVKSVQEQFSEYSRVTLAKLEELAKQCRNSVIAAEAQIASHRSNAKDLSDKLKETEDLLRESISECLSLKQKLKQAEEQRVMQKYALISGLKEKLGNVAHPSQVEDVMDELTSDIELLKGMKMDPFVCVYCQQGKGHKLCDEKIKAFKAEERKLRTELKLLIHETKEEKLTLRNHHEVAENSVADLNSKNQALRETLKSLESKNASLLERLKVEINRGKNMERFRRLEIEGFQTDIKNLKTNLRDMDKQLLKAVLTFERNNQDMELLKTVHDTAQRSKNVTGAIRRLKAKLYELENTIKNL